MMIAKSFAQQTRIILLDEPTAFLDYPNKVEVKRQLRRMANEMNKTILLSTHDLNLTLYYIGRMLVLKQELGEITRGGLNAYQQSLARCGAQ